MAAALASSTTPLQPHPSDPLREDLQALPAVRIEVIQADAFSPARNSEPGVPAVLKLSRSGPTNEPLYQNLFIIPRPAFDRFHITDGHGASVYNAVQFEAGQSEVDLYVFYHFTESAEAPVRMWVGTTFSELFQPDVEPAVVHLHATRPENRPPRVSVAVLGADATAAFPGLKLTNPELVELVVTAVDPDSHPKTARSLQNPSPVVEFPPGEPGQPVSVRLPISAPLPFESPNPTTRLFAQSIVVTDDRGDSVTNYFPSIVQVEKRDTYGLRVIFPDDTHQAPTTVRVEVDRSGMKISTNVYTVSVTGLPTGTFRYSSPHRTNHVVFELPLEFPGSYTLSAPGTNLNFRIFKPNEPSEISFRTHRMTFSRNSVASISLVRVGPADTNCWVHLNLYPDIGGTITPPPTLQTGAVSGLDYVIPQTVVEFKPGQRELTLPVELPPSVGIRGNRSLNLLLVGLTNATVAGDQAAANLIILENKPIAEVRPRLQLVGAATAQSVTLALQFEGDASIARESSIRVDQAVIFSGNGTPQQYEFHPIRPGIHRFVASLTDKWQRRTVSAELEVDVPLLTLLNPADLPLAPGMAQLEFVPPLLGYWIEASTDLEHWETILPLYGSSDFLKPTRQGLSVPRLSNAATFYRTRRPTP